MFSGLASSEKPLLALMVSWHTPGEFTKTGNPNHKKAVETQKLINSALPWADIILQNPDISSLRLLPPSLLYGGYIGPCVCLRLCQTPSKRIWVGKEAGWAQGWQNTTKAEFWTSFNHSLSMLGAKTTSLQLQVSRDSQRKRAHTSLGKLVLKEYTLDTSLH